MRRMVTLLIGLLTVTTGLAGCIGDEDTSSGEDGELRAASTSAEGMTFTDPMLIDDTRAGGEPVIAITHEGTVLVSAHPGWTHYHPSEDPTQPGTELVTPANGQSYLWRSTDDGATWNHIGTPMAGGEGPRGLGLGVSDPDFTVSEDRIYRTDLEALASASVDWSSDDGQTWIEGNPLASHGAVDRQWVASHEDTVYFTANYFAPTPGRHVWASSDGVVWEQRGDIPQECGADFLASPHDGTLYAGCGASVAVSTDGGETWETRTVPGHEGENARMTEPVVDGAGNLWTAWAVDETELYMAGSPDKGETWPWVHEVSDDVAEAIDATGEHTLVWPWISAGSQGRVALSVYATPTPPPSDSGPEDRVWSVVTVAAFQADSQSPDTQGYVLAEGHHVGAICQSGTFCQVSSVQGDANSDRRLGDFFETTIDHEGRLHIAYSDTATHPEDVVSHPGYVRQDGGPSFLEEGSSFVPTQG